MNGYIDTPKRTPARLHRKVSGRKLKVNINSTQTVDMEIYSPHRIRSERIGAVALAFIVLAACSPRSSSPTPTTVFFTPTPTTVSTVEQLQGNQASNSIVGTYHGVLMLERATDLLLAVIEKIQAGKIPLNDSSTISSYTRVFPLAVDYLRQWTPPMEFETPWEQITMVVQQYNLARSMVLNGTQISSQILDILKDSRQLLDIDQEMLERYLANGSLGADFFSAERHAVDEHIQQSYGDQSVPILLP